jgi:hypothetical protein
MNSVLPKARLAISLTVILMLMSFLTVAQPNRRPDVVYLKNGSIVRGVILEVVPNETIKIKTPNGRTSIFKLEEVERAGKYKNEKIIPKPWGYFLMARLAPNIRLFDMPLNFSASIINGMQVNQYISLGIGAEATTYVYDEYDNARITIFPIFFDARFYNPKHVVQPMFSMQFGYSFTGNKKNDKDGNGYHYEFEPDEAGLFLGINGGIRLQATKRTAIIVEGGFSMQTLHDKTSLSVTQTKNVGYVRGNFGVCWNFGPEKKWAQYYRDH